MSSQTQTYTVIGMTCAHCVSAVIQEVRAIAEVTDVDVDLGTGELTVTAKAPVKDSLVAGAVEEAGYALVE